MTTKAIEEEYWTFQYRTSVGDYRDPQFWPPDGEGKYSTEQDAEDRARGQLSDYRSGVRVLHVTRRIEYGPEITSEDA